MLTLQSYLKGRERKFAAEYSEEKSKNAAKIVAKASELLSAFGHKRGCSIGWTPLNIAKRDGIEPGSPHIYGQAIGIEDFDKKFGAWCCENVERLAELDLYMQSLLQTHLGEFPFVRLQIVKPKCHSRIFFS